MKKSGKKITILLILASIIMIAAVIFTVINYKNQTLEKNMTTIKDTYKILSEESTKNSSIRISLTKKMALNENQENYPKEHKEYIELLNKYDESINKITKTFKALEPKCKKEYEDASTKVFCKTYLGMYEEIINMYIRTTTQYNDLIQNYNETHNGLYAPHTLVKTEYLDLNGDGYYSGKVGIVARIPEQIND